MSLLHALTTVFRSRYPVQATGATGISVDTATAAVSTRARQGDAFPAAATGAPMAEVVGEPSAQEKQLMLHLTNVSHAVNHFQACDTVVRHFASYQKVGYNTDDLTFVFQHRISQDSH